jgi:hypothetical protein
MSLKSSIEAAQAQIEKLDAEHACLSKIRDAERRAIHQRTLEMEMELRKQLAIESTLQARYQKLLDELE